MPVTSLSPMENVPPIFRLMIACLPTCQGPDAPPRFPPITYEAYLTWWYDANYNAAVQNDERPA